MRRLLDRDGYLTIAVDHCERIAVDDRVNRAIRVYHAALARVGDDGHAGFAAGELRGILGDGGKDASAACVSRAIARAKTLGLIGPESSSRRLVVDACPVHGPTTPDAS